MTHFGKLIRGTRAQLQLSQPRFGELVGADFQKVSHWERGVEMVSLARATDIAQSLGLRPAPFIRAVLQDHIDGAELSYKIGVDTGKSAPANLGERLRKLRFKQGVALCELADRLEVSPSRVTRLEGGERLRRPDTIYRYAKALGVDPREPVKWALLEAVQQHCGGGFRVSVRTGQGGARATR